MNTQNGTRMSHALNIQSLQNTQAKLKPTSLEEMKEIYSEEPPKYTHRKGTPGTEFLLRIGAITQADVVG